MRRTGWLPLAIEQAAAYIAQVGITPADYQDLLKRYPAVMYAETVEGGDAQRTMARIWHITLDRLVDTPAAGQVLRTLAWYAPVNIPRTLLNGIADEPTVLRAIGRLSAYNMITTHEDQISVHRLVQAVTRTPAVGDRHRAAEDIAAGLTQAVADVADAIVELEYRNPHSWKVYRALAPHVQALTAHTTADSDTVTTALVLLQLGRFLSDQGRLTEAIGYLQRSARSRERVLGTDHPDTLISRSSLASAYRVAGDASRAIPLLEAVLADCGRVLGADHPETVGARSNLAQVYLATGDVRRAIPLFEANLADCERVSGADHPNTLASRNNLAAAYQDAGDASRAIPLHEAVLADRERVLGTDHPDTLISRNNLASACRIAGDASRAISLLEAVLADRERVLGADHPETLTSRNSLASGYRAAGDVGRAIPLYEAARTGRERVLGVDHPHTLISRGDLAGAYQTAGDVGRAISLLEAVLADCERV
ncbi:tetratricopeptide repeat protein [Amycolatopsis sp. NBC_00355]|uniref:tetratricopeptide repeat protein n=1 Tax=Amycolatopsis sp. NBC_00355 TaxID=2975957 RepID=UPI002E275856